MAVMKDEGYIIIWLCSVAIIGTLGALMAFVFL
jgi:hypothetical protein